MVLLVFGGVLSLLLNRATGALTMHGQAVSLRGVLIGDRLAETGRPEKERDAGGSAGTKAEFMVWARWSSGRR